MGQEAWGNDISTVSNTYYYSAFKILEGNRFNTYNAKYRREFGNSSTKNPRFDLIGRDLIMNIAGETDGIQSNLRWRKVGNGGHVNNGASLIKVSNGNRTTAR